MSDIRQNSPRDWQKLTLQEVVEVDNKTLRPDAGHEYLYVGLEHIESGTGRFVGVQNVDGGAIRSQKHYFDAEHVLYGKLRPYLNKVALPDFSGICSTDILPLRPKPNVNRDYIAYWLRSPGFLEYALNHASGTKMPRLGPSQLLASPIRIPPLPVQAQIATILRRADEIRGKRQRALEIADAILPSAFMDMFGDPRTNPRGFEIAPLEKVGDIRSGVAKGRKLAKRVTVEVPYLRVANVQDGFLDLKEVRSLEVPTEDVERYHLEDGDVLLIEGCGNPNYLGRGSIWREEIPGAIHQNHIFRVRTYRDKLLPEYLASLLRTQYANAYFKSCAKNSSGLYNINSTQVRDFRIPVPPIRLQAKFLSAVEAWDQTIARLTKAHQSGMALFDGLMQQAFSGELTAEWEAVNADAIIALVTFDERLPRLILLSFLAEKAKRASSAAIRITALMKYVFLLQMEGAVVS